MPRSLRLTKALYDQVFKEVFFLCLFLLVLHFKGQDSPAMSFWVAALVLARFLLIGKPGDWKFFLMGIFAGGGNDIMSMIKGVYRYTPDHILKKTMNLPIPPWMVVFWGWLFTSFRHLFLLPPFQGGLHWKPGWERGVLDLITAISLRLVIYNTVRQEPLPTLWFAGILAARFLILPPKPHEWRLMATAFVIGPGFEALLIKAGLYEYDDPVLLGMPAWLILYWSFAIPLLMKGVFDKKEMSFR